MSSENSPGDSQEEILNGLDYGLSSDEDYSDEPVVFLSDDELGEDDLDEDYDFRDALRAAGNFRTKKKPTSKSAWKRKMMRSVNRDLDPEVRMHLSKANEAFVRRDLEEALQLYQEVIKLDPKNFNAYKTLGEIYKTEGKLHECCNYWLLAANIHPWDSQFWANVAELSAELGHIDQAIFCYSKAISSDTTKNPNYILERANLYKDKKQYGRALEGFQRLHAMFPTDATIVKNLASIYVEQKRLNDAINLYMSILDQNINSSGNQDQIPEFDWTELNILCELYITQHTYKIGIKVIKLVARWLQQRQDETWWDQEEHTDMEFDERRHEYLKTLPFHLQELAKSKSYDLPIDIRFKLGILRLGLDEKDEAIVHFDFLLDETEDIADLHLEAGKALEAQGYNEEALHYLTKAYENEEYRTVELLSLMGKCYLEINDFKETKRIYTSLIQECPDDVDMKLILVQALYHLGESVAAGRLLDQAKDALNAVGAKATIEEDDIVTKPDDHRPLIENAEQHKSPRGIKMTDEERTELENNATRKVLEKYKRMQRLQEAIEQNEDRIAASAWIKLASQLIEMFISVRSFFPRDKNRLFKGIILYKRKKKMGLDEKFARVFNLYEGLGGETDSARHELTAVTEYRGLSYNQWFEMFMQYAVLLSSFERNTENAIQIVDIAQSVSVFVQDKNKSGIMKLIKIMLCIRNDDTGGIAANVRLLLMTNQFSQYIYKFFMCCFASGYNSWVTFTSYNHQKFFLRQLKAYDSVVNQTKINGMATITANAVKGGAKLKHEPFEILFLYSNLLGGSRSYVSSIVYMNRAYQRYNQDPMMCFVLGLSHIHRAMQRLSSNRHLQLLQGLSYLFEYRDLKLKNATAYEEQEVEFNFGRLFHMLGLPNLAVDHYEKVFAYSGKVDEEYDLLMEAAHNLSFIYTLSGNGSLSRQITEKYLTI